MKCFLVRIAKIKIVFLMRVAKVKMVLAESLKIKMLV